MKETLRDDFGRLIRPSGSAARLSDLDVGTLREQLAESGVLLFRGFADVDLRAFADFTESFGAVMGIHSAGAHRPLEESDSHTRRVTSGKDDIQLHSEAALVPTRPDFLWFCCVRPAASAGQTTVCDGRAILRALSSDTRSLFESKRLKYLPMGGSIHPQVWRQAMGVEETAVARRIAERMFSALLNPTEAVELDFDADDSMRVVYLTPAIVESPLAGGEAFANSIRGPYVKYPCFEDDTPIPDSVIEEIERIGEELSVEVDWEPGDVVMIDNWRVMHGRRAFEDDQRLIAHRMAGPRCDFAGFL